MYLKIFIPEWCEVTLKFRNYNLINMSRERGKYGGLVSLVNESFFIVEREMKILKKMEYFKVKICVKSSF